MFKNILLALGFMLMIFVIGWGRDVTNMPLIVNKTKAVEGKIVEIGDIKIQDGVMQQIKYVFEADGQTYEGLCEVGGWINGFRDMSDTVGVKYVVKDPSVNKIVWFKNKSGKGN